MVSDEEKAPLRRQVGIRKANVSESLLKCRNPKYDIETGAYNRSWDESGGCPFTGQVGVPRTLELGLRRWVQGMAMLCS